MFRCAFYSILVNCLAYIISGFRLQIVCLAKMARENFRAGCAADLRNVETDEMQNGAEMATGGTHRQQANAAPGLTGT